MSIVFLASTVADFFNDGADNFTSTTDTTLRDPNYQPYDIEIEAPRGDSNPFTIEFGSAVADVWVHYRMLMPATSASAASGDVFRFLNVNDDVLLIGDLNSNDLTLDLYADSFTTSISSNNFTENVVKTIDIHLQVNPTEMVADFYVNGTLLLSATGANTAGLEPAPTRFEFSVDDWTSGFDETAKFSEIIVTDGEDTRGWRLATLEPDGAGNYTDFDGAFGDVAGFDIASAIGTGTADDRASFSLSAYNGTATPAGIRGVFAKSLASKGDTGPTNMRQFLRIGGTDYDGSSVALDFSLGGFIEEWATNPAGGAWSTSDFASLEVGVKAET